MLWHIGTIKANTMKSMFPRAVFISLFGLLTFFTNVHAQDADVDPPARVAHLNYFSGNVSFAPSGSDQWANAYLNRTLAQGDQIWADDRGRAEVHIGSSALRLNERTSLQITALDDRSTQLKLTEGTLSFRVRDLADDESFEVDTPNLAFALREPGEYRVTVDPANDRTIVTVRKGRGMLYGNEGNSNDIETSEQIEFGGTDLHEISATTRPRYDAFDDWVTERNRGEDGSVSARYVSREVIGYQELDRYGSWNSDPQYGSVWVPSVRVVDWAPYRYGHWVWIAPWGWTWVDDQPWGYAPFHYGRWVQLRSRWAWVPGPRHIRPVYAPALVAFVGGRSGGTSWSISVGSPGVAWFPLAPGEAFRPAYRVSPRYVTRVNNTINVTHVTNVYVNQRRPHAVTSMRAQDFVQGHPVQQHRVQFNAAQNAPVVNSPNLAPTKQSFTGRAEPTRIQPAVRDLRREVIRHNGAGPKVNAQAVPTTQGVRAIPSSPSNATSQTERNDRPGRNFNPNDTRNHHDHESRIIQQRQSTPLQREEVKNPGNNDKPRIVEQPHTLPSRASEPPHPEVEKRNVVQHAAPPPESRPQAVRKIETEKNQDEKRENELRKQQQERASHISNRRNQDGEDKRRVQNPEQQNLSRDLNQNEKRGVRRMENPGQEGRARERERDKDDGPNERGRGRHGNRD